VPFKPYEFPEPIINLFLKSGVPLFPSQITHPVGAEEPL
jgi:hypothetical protein